MDPTTNEIKADQRRKSKRMAVKANQRRDPELLDAKVTNTKRKSKAKATSKKPKPRSTNKDTAEATDTVKKSKTVSTKDTIEILEATDMSEKSEAMDTSQESLTTDALQKSKSSRHMGKGIAYSWQAKKIVVHIFNTLAREDPSASYNSITRQTALITGGVSESQIRRIRREAPKHQNFQNPVTKEKRAPRTSRCDFRRAEMLYIRRKYDEIVQTGEVPNCIQIHDMLRKSGRSGITKSTLRRMCIDMGFRFPRYMKKDYLAYTDEMVLKRRSYLREIYDYRQEGKRIYYCGEMVLDDTTQTPKYSGGAWKTNLNSFVVLHAASEVFPLEGMLEVFSVKVTKYQFEDWLKKLFPQIPKGSVIVMHRRLYNSAEIEEVPTMDWSKFEIQRWLDTKHIPWKEDSLKSEFVHQVNQVKNNYGVCRVERIAAIEGYVVLKIPPFYDELDPFDELWTIVQGELIPLVQQGAAVNTVKSAVSDMLRRISPQNWKCYMNRVIEQEKKSWELDEILEKFFEGDSYQEDYDYNTAGGEFSDAEFYDDYR